MNVRIETAVHMGLIINELITNSIKHAWLNNNIEAKIRLITDFNKDTGNYHILYQDNGRGFPEQRTPGDNNSYGLELIDSITEQYNGNIQRYSQEGGVVSINLVLGKI